MRIPENMAVVLDDQFEEADYPGFSDDPYFKLVHRLTGLKKPSLDSRFQLASKEIWDFAKHIDECYEGKMNGDDLMSYPQRPTYDPALWVAVVGEDDRLIGSAIGEIDSEIGEGIIEWVEVSKEYRKQGLGAFLVDELLWRMKEKVNFVTVSGRANNESNPEALYRKCGFGEKAIWHILTKKNMEGRI